jgi:hypothetical protein
MQEVTYMNRKLLAWGLVCVCSSAPALAASTTQQTQPDRNAATAVTVEGCVTREADVPGRQPTDADRERWKRDDDYILTDAKMVKGSAPQARADRPSGDTPTGTAGSAGAPLLFKIEKLPIDQVRAQRSKRVQIDGTFRNEERSTNPVSTAFDLVKLDGTSMRTIAGDCPAK